MGFGGTATVPDAQPLRTGFLHGDVDCPGRRITPSRYVCVTRPREVVPDRSYMLVRRCTQRMFLLRPDKEMNEAIVYCAGVAALRTGVKLTSLLAMANHPHTTVVDIALKRRRDGDVTVEFPFGTYQLRRLGLVRCQSRPPDPR